MPSYDREASFSNPTLTHQKQLHKHETDPNIKNKCQAK